MPIYTYRWLEGPHKGSLVEIAHSAKEAPLAMHPETHHALKQVFVAPHLATRYTPGRSQKLLDNKNLEKNGFTKYQRDKLTGKYHRVAGKDGPAVMDKPPA